MALLDFLPILGDITGAIRKYVPDTAERDRMAGQLDSMQLGLAQAQAAITAAESQSPSLFKSGWRPAVGWLCVLGLWIDFMVFPLVSMALQLAGKPAISSPLDIGSLLALLGSLLGLGGMRTVERLKGKA